MQFRGSGGGSQGFMSRSPGGKFSDWVEEQQRRVDLTQVGPRARGHQHQLDPRLRINLPRVDLLDDLQCSLRPLQVLATLQEPTRVALASSETPATEAEAAQANGIKTPACPWQSNAIACLPSTPAM